MIPVFTLERQNKILKKELERTIKEVIDRGIFILGSKVGEFEEAMASYLGVKYAVGVASGTDALVLSLLAVGVGRGDEVILPANAYPTAFAVTAIGAIPKLVDIDPLTFNLNPAKIPQAINKKTKAIIPVHLYGQPADMEAICNILKQKIYIIEDCAQAHGGEYKFKVQSSKFKVKKALRHLGGGRHSQTWLGRLTSRMDSPEVERTGYRWQKVGTIGDLGCFSFYPTKNLGCFGDGGMIVTNNPEIYERVKLLRMYGEKTRYQSVLLGRNSRLDELQAAILLVKLKYLDKWNSRRREIAKLYFSTFSKLNQTYPFLCSPKEMGGKKGRPSEGFLISLSSGDRGEPSPMTSTGFPHLHHSQREIAENASRASIIQLPLEAPFAKHVYHLYVVRTKKRDQLKEYLEKKGIQTAIHYPKPIHFQPSFKFLDYKEGDFPESEKTCGEILSLPMYPELRDGEVKRVVNSIVSFLKFAPHTSHFED